MAEIETYRFTKSSTPAQIGVQRVTRSSDGRLVGNIERRRTAHGELWAASDFQLTASTDTRHITWHKKKGDAATFLDALDRAQQAEYTAGQTLVYQTGEGVLREATVIMRRGDTFEIAEAPGQITMKSVARAAVAMATRIGGPGGLPVARRKQH